MKAFLQIETNRYRGECVTTRRVFLDAEKAKGDFDQRHPCEIGPGSQIPFCDYCSKTKWEKSHGGWVRNVNWDGASVEYAVRPVEVVE